MSRNNSAPKSKIPSSPRSWRRRLTLVALVGSLGGAGTLWAFHRWIEQNAVGRIFTDEKKVPYRKVGLLLGTSKELSDGRENLYFRHRTNAAAKLFHEGKISHLLVSGDNGVRTYDEPSDMRDRLVELGVPISNITCDYAGFRTLDSVVRAKEIFGVDSLLLISDGFHVERALFLADKKGIEGAIAYASERVGGLSGRRMQLRELLARAKAVADIYLLRTEPKFLGEKEPIIVSGSRK